MRPGSRPWSATDDADLRIMHKQNFKVPAMAAMLRRTQSSTIKRLHRLGLVHIPRWSKNEVAVLMREIRTGPGMVKSLQRLSLILHRSPDALERKFQKVRKRMRGVDGARQHR